MENWKIKYHVKTPEEIVQLEETFNCLDGYHQQMIDAFKSKGHEPHPLHRVRGDREQGFGFVFFDFFLNKLIEGYKLPIDPESDIRIEDLVCDEAHPIVFIAPDQTEYIKTEI